jgi:hypothetical protein
MTLFAAAGSWLLVQYRSESDLDVMSLAPSKEGSELDWFLQYDRSGIRGVLILPRSTPEKDFRALVEIRTHWFYGGRRIAINGRPLKLHTGLINLQIVGFDLEQKQIWIEPRNFPQSVMSRAIDEETVLELVDLAS